MPNRLIDQKSPYLLQHAHNPVDWYSWGTEAFETARQAGKPVFLSVGYATCHWCHVMEKESFEDPLVAAALNDAFVCIKVDREERPDIDAVYMAVCHMVTGRGGWPLNIIMTPDKKPFFAATYLPRTSRFGRLGIMELCDQIRQMWRNDRERVLSAADGLGQHLQGAFDFAGSQADPLDQEVLDRAYVQIERSFDSRHGGFDGAPKFPTAHRLIYLMRCYGRTRKPFTLEMVTRTLTAMRLGGLWDHAGFGFHRYATDERWLLPHFEKMLYDQAFLAIAYLEAYQLTGDRFLARTAEEIFTYVLRDMTSAQGGFFTAQDADSEGEEGKYYVWPQTEFQQILAGSSVSLPWERIFNVRPEGNFADEATRQPTGTNILHLTRSLEDWAKTLNLPTEQVEAAWEKVRRQLFEARLRRVPPLKDDKILTDWNGMMIAALALGSRVLAKSAYAEAAGQAVAFVFKSLVGGDGRLRHRFRDGETDIAPSANDYAFLVMGLIELYRTNFDTQYLEQGIGLQHQMDDTFWDATNGGYYLTAAQDRDLPVRPKELYDGAVPSANSVALNNLLLLGRLTGDARWEERANQLVQAFAATVAKQPAAFTHFLSGVDLALNPGREVVVTGNRDASDTQAMLNALRSLYAPNLVVHLKSGGNARQLAQMAGFTAGLQPEGNQATAHICKNFACQNAQTDVTKVLEALIAKEHNDEPRTH